MLSNVHLTLCLLMAACVAALFPSPYNVGRRPHAPRICALPSHPCRLRVTMKSLNNTYLNRIHTPTCTCNGGECPDDWTDRRHVVSRRLISDDVKMTLQMMFCDVVQPKNTCTTDPLTGQPPTALVVSGMGNYPTNIVAYNCRCRRERAMVLHERRIINHHTHGYQQQHSYVCAYDKASCANHSSICMVISETHTDYTCKCPRGTHCQVPPDAPLAMHAPQEHMRVYGYCRPLSAWPN